jgi:hypothetical protein
MLASFAQHHENDAVKMTLASFKLMTQNDTRLTYTYHGFRHLQLVPRVLRYSTGFYGTAVTLRLEKLRAREAKEFLVKRARKILEGI